MLPDAVSAAVIRLVTPVRQPDGVTTLDVVCCMCGQRGRRAVQTNKIACRLHSFKERPHIVNEDHEKQFTFRTIQTNDEKLWHVVFTSQDEFTKDENSAVISHFIYCTLQFCLQTEANGYIINPLGQSFLLTKELIQMIYEADGSVEYTVPDEPITEELLEDGSFLKKAIEIRNRNRTQLKLIKLARILWDSYVWVPCNIIMSDEDYDTWSKAVLDAADKGDMDSLIGQEFIANDNIRMVPDIL